MKKPQDDDLGDCPICEKKFGIKAPLVRTERKMGKPTMRFSANRLIIGCSRYKKGCTYTTIKPISNIIVPLPLINKESQNFDDAFINALDALKRDDYETAYKLFLPLAEQGNIDGQRNLGMLHYLGQGVAEDYAEAIKWWKLAAEQGDDFSQYQLGLMHLKEAEKWMRLSAEQGNADAQFTLGLMHLGELGETEGYPGETEDHKETEKWMKLSAEQNNADAQCLLGDMYLEGMGVTEDYAEAIKWWKLAAEQGHERAKYNLDNYK
jgi:TPR repeat protein